MTYKEDITLYAIDPPFKPKKDTAATTHKKWAENKNKKNSRKKKKNSKIKILADLPVDIYTKKSRGAREAYWAQRHIHTSIP